MLLSRLLGAHVTSENGWSLGRVFDVRVVDGGDGPVVVGLVVGRRGLAERLVGQRTSEPGEVTHAAPLIDWRDVVRLQGQTVVVRDGTEPGGGQDEVRRT